jgi:hypothetical protein
VRLKRAPEGAASRGAWVLAAALCAWLPMRAAAQFIAPGHEAEVAAAVGRAAAQVPGTGIAGIGIDGDAIRVQLTRGAVAHTAVVAAPACPTCPVDVSGVDGVRGLSDALAQEFGPLAGALWTVDDARGRPRPRAAPAWIARLLLALAMLWAVVRVVLAARTSRVWRVEVAGVLAGLGAFVVVALVVPARGPLHDHNAFVFRNDCAWSLSCDYSAGWSPVFFHTYGPILRALPVYDERAIEHLGLALTTLALGLGYAFARRLVTPHVGARRAALIGAFSTFAVATSPVFLRLSVSDTPWPYVLVLLFGAGLAALDARDTGRVDAAVVATILLGLAALTSYAMVGLLLLPPVAVVAWAARRPRRAPVLAVVFTLAFAIPGVLAIGASPSATALASWLPDHRPEWVALDPRWTSFVLLPLALVGVAAAVRDRARHLVLPFAAFVAASLPAAMAGSFAGPHPTRLLFSMPEHALAPLFSAIGLDAILRGLAARWGRRAAVIGSGVVAAAWAIGLAAASDGRAFAVERDTLARELDAIESMLPELPDAAVLVVPDALQGTSTDSSSASDPVEVQFPVERARRALTRPGAPAPWIVPASRLLAQPLHYDGALVYSGVSWRSFVRGEIVADRLPARLEREQLRALRALGELVPTVERTIEVHDHPLRGMRVLADRERTMVVGFYRWSPRGTGR